MPGRALCLPCYVVLKNRRHEREHVRTKAHRDAVALWRETKDDDEAERIRAEFGAELQRRAG